MNTLLWTTLILTAATAVALMRAIRRAPLGYEDAEGFHAGSRPGPVIVAVEARGPSRSERAMAAGR